ncbi:MAG: hypothetical protein ABI091_29520 [Ferruginibacter sp.]
MKSIFLFFILSIVISSLYGQYTVTKVNGRVINLTTKEVLKPGSHLSENDKMQWSSPHDMVRTIIAGKGIYIITPSPESQKEGSKLMDVVKFTLHIKSREFNLSGRGENEEIIPWVFSTESAINTKNLIATVNKYLFDTAQFNLSNGNSFFLQIDPKSGVPVVKPLTVIGDTLLLYGESFITSPTMNIDETKYTIGFYNKEQNSSRQLIRLYPYFDTSSEMKTLIRIIIDSDGHGDMEQVRVRCYQEVYETMGKPSYILFNDLFEKLYKVLRLKAK